MKKRLFVFAAALALLLMLCACAANPTQAPGGPPNGSLPMQALVGEGLLHVYESPDEQSAVLASLADGALVYVMEIEPAPDWHKVQTEDGITGYARMYWLVEAA